MIEEALVSAARRAVGPANGLDVHLDSATGEIHAIAKLKVVDKIEEPGAEIDRVSRVDSLRLEAARGVRPRS